VAEDLQSGDPESVGPYRLLGRLGAGGMGRVYLARSPGGRLTAVKVIRPELAAEPGFRARFAREVASARTVSGVFTAPVLDADPEGPQPWLATAYVPGPSLAEAVAQRGPLAPGDVPGLGAGLAEGLQAVHAAGLVHRDLKPSNVLLADDGPRIIDFGISRAVDSVSLTQTGMVIGSPGFLSPEQAEGRETGTAGDIFSLGAVLVFAATGEGPFGAGTVPALIYRVVSGQPNLSGVPELLRPVIARCLDKDPARRPGAGELLTLLAAIPGPPAGPGPAYGTRAPAYGAPPAPVYGTPPPAYGAQPAPAYGAQPAPGYGTPQTPAYGPPPGSGNNAGPQAPGYYGPPPGRYYGAPGTAPGWGQAGPGGPPVTGPGQFGRPPGNGPRGRGPGGNGRRAGLIAGAVLVIAAAVTAIALAAGGHPGHPAAGSASGSASPAASAGASTAPPGNAGSETSPAASGSTAVTGAWTGTYTCNQGLTGVRLTISGASGDGVTALVDFYPVASNPGSASGSYEMTGRYDASGGLVLNPDYWIDQPPGYEMVGLTAPPPGSSSMSGTVQGVGCTTFSVSR
jgi:hypothetical protein